MNSPTLAHSTEEKANVSSVISESPAQETNARVFSNFMGSNLFLDTYDWQSDNVMNFLPPPQLPINQHMYRSKQVSTGSIASLPVENKNNSMNKDLSCDYPSAKTTQMSFPQNHFNAPNIGYNNVIQHSYPSPYSQANTFKTTFHSTPDLLYDSKLDPICNNGKFDLGSNSFDSTSSPNNSYMRFSDNESSGYIRSYSQTSCPSDFEPYSFTPTLSDVYTPTFSDTPCFTPNTTINEDFATAPIVPSMFDQVMKNIQNPKPLNPNQKASSLGSLNGTNGTNKKYNAPVLTSYTSPKIPLNHSSPQLVDGSYHNTIDSQKGNYIPKPIYTTNSNQQVFALHKNPESSSLRAPSFNNSEKDVTTTRRTGCPTLNEAFAQKAPEFSNSKVHKPAQPIAQADGNTKTKRYTRRRLSPRSKSGCWICRIKHLKCDEQKPTCSGCFKFGVECDYSEKKPAYVSDKNLRKEKLLSISIIRKRKQNIKGQNKIFFA